MYSAKVARQLVRLRRKAKVSQQLVADFTGISQESLSRYERAQRVPKTPALLALAEFYGVGLEDLVGEEKNLPF